MIDKFLSTRKRNEKFAQLGKERRAKLLECVPNTFTAKELTAASGQAAEAINAQIQKMIRHKEVTQNSERSKPRIYTKVTQ